tara:strand:+ start:5352 stop:6185 length:834 start_codon:yes stop_codon:yes gene_type:complete
MTIIGKAKELVEQHGEEYAIEFFENRINEIGDPKSFQDVCNISGNETAIQWIKGKIPGDTLRENTNTNMRKIIKTFKQFSGVSSPTQLFKLFVDMDGVLTDFVKRFKELKENTENLDFESYINKHGVKASWALVDKYGLKWWSHMEWMKDGKELWEHVLQYDPCILSSPSRSKDSVNGKAIWCRRELGLTQKEPTISPKVHKEPKYNRWDIDTKMIINTQKDLFAKRFENSILIDDTKKKIDGWVAKGGIGILHKNTKDTIEQLNKIIEELNEENNS